MASHYSIICFRRKCTLIVFLLFQAKFAECAELHNIATNAKAKISEIQEKYLSKADQVNELLVEKHAADVSNQVAFPKLILS